MKPREARRYVYRVLATTLRNDIDNWAGRIEEGAAETPLTESEIEGLQEAAEKVYLELLKKAK